jgi:hypothetical protein
MLANNWSMDSSILPFDASNWPKTTSVTMLAGVIAFGWFGRTK